MLSVVYIEADCIIVLHVIHTYVCVCMCLTTCCVSFCFSRTTHNLLEKNR